MTEATMRNASRRRGGPALLFARKKFFVLLLLAAFAVGGGCLMSGKVISVADGDSLSVLEAGGGSKKIRLYGIDCPELQQAGGREAAAFTEETALFAKVSLTLMHSDRYGRAVAIVTLPDGRVLNEELIRNGHAWVEQRHCRAPQCASWKRLEKKARANRIGLWQAPSPVPPWKWRNLHPR